MMLRILTGICLCFSFIEAHNDEHNPRFRRSIYEVYTLHIKQKFVKLPSLKFSAYSNYIGILGYWAQYRPVLC